LPPQRKDVSTLLGGEVVVLPRSDVDAEGGRVLIQPVWIAAPKLIAPRLAPAGLWNQVIDQLAKVIERRSLGVLEVEAGSIAPCERLSNELGADLVPVVWLRAHHGTAEPNSERVISSVKNCLQIWNEICKFDTSNNRFSARPGTQQRSQGIFLRVMF
jgi:hypothetical protein